MSSENEDTDEELEMHPYDPFAQEVSPFHYEDPLSNSTILQAVLLGDTEKVQELISAGRSLNVTDNNGNTALHLAVMKENNKMVQLLLMSEMNVDHRNFMGNTPLLLALKLGSINSIILQLLAANCNVNIKNNKEKSALHLAVRYSNLDIMHLLIEHGADVNAQNGSLLTPLHKAAQQNNLTAVCMLLYYNANTNIRCKHGFTPFVYSIMDIEASEITDVLFQYYNKFTSVSNVSTTAFTMAIQCDNHPIIYELIKTGIGCGYRKNEVTDALDYALEMNDIKLFKVILNQIAGYANNILVNYDTLFVSVLRNTNITISTSLNCFYLLVEHCLLQNIRDYDYQLGDIWLYISKYVVDFNIDSDTKKCMLLSILSLGLKVNSSDLVHYCRSFGNGDEVEILYLNHILDCCNYYEIPPLVYFEEIILCSNSLDLKFRLERSYCNYVCNIPFLYSKGDNGYPLYLGYTSISSETLVAFDRHFSKFEMDNSILSRLSLLPNVPSLLELSRNAAALDLVSKFNIKQPYQFFDVVNRQDIPRDIKDLLLFRKPVYNI